MNYRRSLTVLLAGSGMLGLTLAWGANPPAASPPKANASVAVAKATATDTLTLAAKGAKVMQATASSRVGSLLAAATTQVSTGAPPPKATLLKMRSQVDDPFLSASVIDDAQLATARGGSSSNQNNTTGAVAGNVASQLTTGSNAISSSAFSDSSGIPIVIQNSGNNVLIQNSTILNLQLTSPK
jgi:hypothetical protein